MLNNVDSRWQEMIDLAKQQLLDIEFFGEENCIIFTDEVKQLIHEASEACLEEDDVKGSMEKADEYGKELSATDVYKDMLLKIVQAPTILHMRMTARMLIPIIDQKIREGHRE
ncbi:MAG: hypothetical protein IJ567_06435 [Lachnospiraceae bacterium]|nr:hypothetical protein [Lachnospiraceae bacterium]